MQIDIDFEVFKALTNMRESEADTYNHVLRRLLDLPPSPPATSLQDLLASAPRKTGLLGSPKGSSLGVGGILDQITQALGGAWFNGVHLPDGTKFRATYKGGNHSAEIKNGHWVDSEGNVRTSPSDAASAISGTNVNGWRFWQVLRPGDSRWLKLDELKP
jgi:hypothetical protein